jgi:hypothetical protein
LSDVGSCVDGFDFFSQVVALALRVAGRCRFRLTSHCDYSRALYVFSDPCACVCNGLLVWADEPAACFLDDYGRLLFRAGAFLIRVGGFST